MTKLRQRYAVALTFFAVVLMFLYSELRYHSAGLHLPIFMRSSTKEHRGYGLQFPASFPKDVSKRELIKKKPAFRAYGVRYTRLLKKRTRGLFLQQWRRRAWMPLMMRVFGAVPGIDLDLAKCGQLLAANTTVEVSPKVNLDVDVTAAVRRLVNEIDRGKNEYVAEFGAYLDPYIRLQVHLGVVDKHWFSMAGSSVYLEEYGYHMVVSRLAYSADGLRNNPQFSFVYAQLFDHDWQEVRDVGLVVPTNTNDDDHVFVADSKNYTIVHYPGIVPVPFYHDYAQPGRKYLGPEDARVVLVQNSAGHTEPLLVFNAEHRKQVVVDDDEDAFLLTQQQHFRSMWVCWPWQTQTGKHAVDDDMDPIFSSRTYSRVKELEIKNTPRQKTQKNWTPFISGASRAQHGYDKHLYFVYRWAHLHVLKCDVTSPHGTCGFTYSVDPKMKVSSNIGPLRGGTPLASLNDVLEQNPSLVPAHYLPAGREVWLGFARAHLYSCGCGKNFYRPNLVVLVKDTSDQGEGQGEGQGNDVFTLTHISSFAPLEIEVIPWDPFRPLDLCDGTNAIIPNGISLWKAHSIKNMGDRWVARDELTLALSVSDCTVDVVHIRGLLDTLMNLRDNVLFLPPTAREDPLAQIQGPTNDNIACAMEESSKYCMFYGYKVETRRAMAMIYGDDEYTSMPYDEDLELYRLIVQEYEAKKLEESLFE